MSTQRPSPFAYAEPVIMSTCLACGAAYAERLGGMVRACRDCAPLVLPSFDQGWTHDTFIVLCQQILASGNAGRPDDGQWRACHFCRRKTNLDDVTHCSAPSLCPACSQKLPARHAQAYLDLFAATPYREPAA